MTKEMTLEELKEMVCGIIDLNGKDEFMYAPSITMYEDGRIVVSCIITDMQTGNTSSGDSEYHSMMERLESEKERMVLSREEYIDRKKREYRYKLARLEGEQQ